MEVSKTNNVPNLTLKSDLTKMQREEKEKLVQEVCEANSRKPTDNSGDYRWKVVGPPESLRKIKVRDVLKWEQEEDKRNRRQRNGRRKPRQTRQKIPLSEVRE